MKNVISKVCRYDFERFLPLCKVSCTHCNCSKRKEKFSVLISKIKMINTETETIFTPQLDSLYRYFYCFWWSWKSFLSQYWSFLDLLIKTEFFLNDKLQNFAYFASTFVRYWIIFIQVLCQYCKGFHFLGFYLN